MMTMTSRTAFTRALLLLLSALAIVPRDAAAQDRLRTMPGYAQYTRMQPLIGSSVRLGSLNVTWVDEGRAFEYVQDGKRMRYVIASKTATEVTAPQPQPQQNAQRGGSPARGRQFESAASPDNALRAFYRDRNLWLSRADGTGEKAITTEGSEKARTKYGTGSWVYGEELGQSTAIWWSPDSRKVAYYRFDESGVPDYFLQLDQTKLQSSVDVEAYPKAGVPNPIVDIYVYDIATGQTTKIDVRDGKPFTDDAVGHYAYRVSWSPDGTELLFNRTNRRQNIMEFVACNPQSGSCRVIVREEWPTGWVMNSPPMQFLADGKRFIWTSERNGFRNLYLYDLSGKLIAPITQHNFEVAGIVRVDEKTNEVWYNARSGDNYMKIQLHRVSLNGRNDRRLTDPAFNHTVSVAPDGRHFVDIAQTHDQPPVTRLLDGTGRTVAELATSDLTRFNELGLQKVELYTFKAADGVTELHGMLHKPSNFDPSKKYPVLVSVYGGPGSNGARETFTTPNALTEYGFLVVTLDARSASGRGKRFLDQIYMKLGVVEIDDMAAAINGLADRSYVDRTRVGIYGTSYGGYASAMALLRHPDVFHAAAASSPVTDWRHYDTIYTERYMWTPQGNTAGYDAGSAMKYVNNLRGRLMLYYGTADNNVHPSNSMELIRALQQAGKSFDVQVGPDAGHTGLNQQRMMEFFIENLVMKAGIVS
jgi:dipeptidyl-peptidase-4